jgi:uncharacterized membrane protein
MNLRPMLIANSTLIATMAGLSAWAWTRLPDEARVPVHWNLAGEPDRFGSKLEALVALPAVAAATTLLLIVLPYVDPRRTHIEASAKFWNAVAISVVLLVSYLHTLIVATALGRHIDMTGAMIPALALLSIVMGNYLSKTRSNWFAGVRTPWTLSSEYSWEQTHRWSGRLFVLGGVLGLLAWLFLDAKTALAVMIVALLSTAIAGVVMSYVFWRTDPERVADQNGGS